MLIGHRIKFVYAAVATVANSQTGLCMPLSCRSCRLSLCMPQLPWVAEVFGSQPGSQQIGVSVREP